MSIMLMTDSLANKIAAGEVVERPASVIKELVENSIDAESSWIKIETFEAGLEKIRLVDNGTGMSEDDVEHAFLRHATSKIQSETDLFHVRSLGFRGEALASIAAVSRIMVKSSKGNQAGTTLTMEGGKVIGKTKSDARQGTEMVVEDLFFNTPARLKYMKSLHTELGHITELLNRFALSHPNIRFEVFHNGRELFRTTGSGDRLQAISNVYGIKVARQMLPVSNASLDFTLSGYIGKPELTRASRNYITIIINGRYIKNYRLTQAIAQGYHTMLPIGRHPIVVLAIDMDPVLVDVNVHPSKLQVRFSKEKELEALVQETIKQTLQKTNLIPEMHHAPNEKPRSIQPQFVFEDRKRHHFEDQEADTQATNGNETMPASEPLQTYKPHNAEPWKSDSVRAQEDPQIGRTSTVRPEDDAEDTEDNAQQVPPMYPIGQLHGTYILAENDNGLYMIDQHAAQERIKYEHFKKQLAHPENDLQDMLIPLTFEFSGQEKIFIDHNKSKLEAIGLYFEEFGPQSYVIRSHPNWFPKGQEEAVIRDMVEQVMQQNVIDIEKIREEAAIMMSCKRSIKANHHLNITDMTHLLDHLRQADNPYTCPHGRPVMIHFTSYELEKMFKRVM